MFLWTWYALLYFSCANNDLRAPSSFAQGPARLSHKLSEINWYVYKTKFLLRLNIVKIRCLKLFHKRIFQSKDSVSVSTVSVLSLVHVRNHYQTGLNRVNSNWNLYQSEPKISKAKEWMHLDKLCLRQLLANDMQTYAEKSTVEVLKKCL